MEEKGLNQDFVGGALWPVVLRPDGGSSLTCRIKDQTGDGRKVSFLSLHCDGAALAPASLR